MHKQIPFERIINKKNPVLILFYLPKCNTCVTMNAILKIVSEQAKIEFSLFQLNLNHYPDIANQYQVKEVPTCLLFEEKELKWKQSGLSSARLIGATLKLERV